MRVLALLTVLCLLLPLCAVGQDGDPRLAEIEAYVLAESPDWADRDAIRDALGDAGDTGEQPDQPETSHNGRLRPPGEFEVMVDRRHAEHAPAP